MDAVIYIDDINVKHHCINMMHSQRSFRGSIYRYNEDHNISETVT